jgi:type II secretory pathway pseudopilin PulG
MTLIELLIVLSIVAAMVAISVPTIRSQLDRLSVRRAMNEVSAFYHSARLAGVVKGRHVRLFFGADSLVAAYADPDSTFMRMAGPARLGVTFSVSRSAIEFQPNGVGWGAANTKIVVRRGAAADSMSTSILGRLRRYGLH